MEQVMATDGPQQNDAWRTALSTRATTATGAMPGTLVHTPATERAIGRGTFLGGIGAVITAGVVGLLDFVWPRGVRPLGEVIAAGNIANIPVGGPPVLSQNEQFWLVHLDPADTGENGSGGGGGILALLRKCPHLGCAVPWEERVKIPVPRSDERAWFQCPCHGSTYTRAGVRVFGPAPRSMDTVAVEIDEAGNITVDTREVTRGGSDNPQRAVRAY
jgi:cytochrome b6-f complex iron-sulfur subunit